MCNDKEGNRPILMYSPLESKRFNLRVFRGNLTDINEEEISSILKEEKVDVAIFRLPSENHYQVGKLLNIDFPYIVADTLVYYYCDLEKYIPKEPMNRDLHFIECTIEHIDSINNLVDEIFVDYTNHYYTNPIFDKKDMIEGYKEWVRGYISNKDNGRVSWLVQQDNMFVGFATCSFHQNESEGVLYGVHPAFSGRGIYGDLIRFTQQYFKDKGYSIIKVSTQIQNYAVQKVWSREGFILKEAYSTIHINSLLANKESIDIIKTDYMF